MKHDKDGKAVFVDKKDKAVFERLLSLYKDKGEIFEMTISAKTKNTTENQMKLWRVLLDHIANETGNDFATIEETLLNGFSASKEIPEQMDNERFQALLHHSCVFANDFLGLNIIYENDKFQVKKH